MFSELRILLKWPFLWRFGHIPCVLFFSSFSLPFSPLAGHFYCEMHSTIFSILITTTTASLTMSHRHVVCGCSQPRSFSHLRSCARNTHTHTYKHTGKKIHLTFKMVLLLLFKWVRNNLYLQNDLQCNFDRYIIHVIRFFVLLEIWIIHVSHFQWISVHMT